jgi:predicted acyl esterase
MRRRVLVGSRWPQLTSPPRFQRATAGHAGRLRSRLCAVIAVLAAASTIAGCTATGGRSSSTPSDQGVAVNAGDKTAPMAPTANAIAGFAGHGSIDEAYEVGATPGTELILTDASRRAIDKGTADAQGALVVANLAPGTGYRFLAVSGSKVAATPTFSVLSTDSTPAPSFYSSQHMHAGLNYIEMRDGVLLAATVRLPQGKTLADGPFPTVIEYSGYAVAAPHSLIDAELGIDGETMSDPLLPDTSTAVGSLLAPLLGFATVSLQMRGTGCSGGAFDLFGLPSVYDGYDAVQIVSSQPWVAHHKVGMVGISYSGISQMFVAGTRPPGLAAIAPLSLTDDLYSTGFPGGILNNGFATSWVSARIHDAEVAGPNAGQPWAWAEIQAGDKTCLANQALHGQAEIASITEAEDQAVGRPPALYDLRSDSYWAKSVDVPVFIVGAYQDDETGGQWSSILRDLTGDPDVFATLMNGTHIDSLGPGTITRWLEFLDIFVAQEVPTQPGILSLLAPKLYASLTGAPSEPLPAVRFTHDATVAQARSDFIASDPRVRLLMDNGGSAADPGAMQPLWEIDLPAWPPPDAVDTTFWLGPQGELSATPPPPSTVAFYPNPATRPRSDLPPSNTTGLSTSPWAALPGYDWAPVTGPSGLGFISAPLTHDLMVAGFASLDLEVMSSASDTDLQATISEVRPDGKEMFVQSGDLRASFRKLDPQLSTATEPVPTYLPSDVESMPAGQFVEVRIPILPFAYAFRAGSRIRITITAPGGDRPVWAFATPATNGKVKDTIQIGGPSASSLVLSVLPGVVPPDPQPPCPSLRGEPCRTYVPAQNGG